MYHKKNVDYAYLLWEYFIYQVENNNVKRNNEMYYPHFTKVIVNFFMTKDSSIPRRNKVNWHFARDDPMFTTIKVVSRHEDTHLYGAIFYDELMNEAIKDSESYKEYYAIASGAEPPKTKASVKKSKLHLTLQRLLQLLKEKRLKTSAKETIPAKKKQPAKRSKAKSLTVLFEVALTQAEQMKLAIEISKTHTHSSHVNGSGADEGTGVIPGVPDVPTYNSDEEQISWKSSFDEDNDAESENDDDDDDDDNQDDDGQEYDVQNDENQNDDNEQTDSNNDGDDFVHPKFSTHDEEDKEEVSFDPRVQTPSHVESTDDDDSDEEIQGANVEGEELDKEETNEEDEANELYRDVNVNLEGRDTEMTDAPRTIIQTTQVIEDTHMIITLVNP
ncbi:hypothetical protein Tco_0947842, partial [Tanacetum coccineum]